MGLKPSSTKQEFQGNKLVRGFSQSQSHLEQRQLSSVVNGTYFTNSIEVWNVFVAGQILEIQPGSSVRTWQTQNTIQ